MQCLNCKAEMFNYDVTTSNGELSYDLCEKCGSLWLDAGELDKMAFKVEGSIEFSTEDEHGGVTAKKVKECPRCVNFALSPVRFLGDTNIVLDHCTNCLGFWLDGGELGLIDREITKLMPVEGHGFSDFVNNVHVPLFKKRIRRLSSETDVHYLVNPISGAKHHGATEDQCPVCQVPLDEYSVHFMKFEACPQCHGLWLFKDELRKLKNTVDDGRLHWLNQEVDNIEKTSVVSSTRSCVKCKGVHLHSVIFGHSGVIIDWCPQCHGMWLDQGEYAAITHYLGQEATEATPRQVEHELGQDLKKVFTGSPEGRLAEIGDVAADAAALANAVIFEHPALFNLTTSVARGGRGIGLA
jgi:Zn-finger nucleic acid-binding protein